MKDLNKISIRIGDSVVDGVLFDNEAARSFASMLPLTYYDHNQWNFTRLGKINGNPTRKYLLSVLGSGSVNVTLSLTQSDLSGISDHDERPDRRGDMTPAPIHVCRNVWIGANATILGGVTIGENAIVAAGAVVTKDVAPDTIVAGVPAREIRKIKAV